ncbi:hypothetical protein GLYMA_08G167700v4 [Glycine max]|uniref:Partial AB-hydrolase lipase domain-containing protein n=1 Tax=Glycine max TaxID=3847 RepID=K7L766_SOYBN|nr:triacylglycerol lipase 2 isoform X3 [Glycine max]KAH1051606.1 hypothetical protein GYH30_021483 [Glycine max]KRH43732.1 hypothetical protein GLYMA_08G167700v4 [Glycine max]
MASTVVSLSSIVLLCTITAVQGRKTLHHLNNEWLTSYSVINDIDGICKTMVETQGYTCEEHQVTTEDGYILSLQRIPVGRSSNNTDKPPVLLQHGIFCDALTWLVNSPDESLGFILADNGYDVWLANTRGTKYSNRHISLDPDDMAYWDWSWDELASYDLPAFVQYVYNHTGQRIHYAGHSLDIYWLGLREFVPNGDVAAKFAKDLCHILNFDCSNLMSLFAGPNCCINSSTIDVFLDHEPPPTATKNLVHLSQMIRTGTIAQYDYGNQEQNMQHYGQPLPPLYDMTGILNEFPLFISYGGQDTLSDVKDVQVLLNDLKDHDWNKLVVLLNEDYAHVDFVMGVNANQMIYDPMMDFFKVN